MGLFFQLVKTYFENGIGKLKIIIDQQTNVP